VNYSIKPVAMIDVRDHSAIAVGGQYFKRKRVAPAESASEAVMMPAIVRWMFIETEADRLPISERSELKGTFHRRPPSVENDPLQNSVGTIILAFESAE
jgi:hypothetical protein